jgi:hypothetical protein
MLILLFRVQNPAGSEVSDFKKRIVVEDVCVLHIPTSSQYVNIFTKGLSSSVFTEFWSNLNVRGNDD